MIRVIMFDLGNTLVRESDLTLFPHVPEALRTLGRFTDDAERKLPLCLVSNFPQKLPVPTAELPQVFASFLEILDKVGLTNFFQPVERCVTLSAHSGMAKPHAACFATALRRLGLATGFDSCFFITEEAEHVAHVRQLGMQALQFAGHQTPAPAGSDFTDWAEAPLRIARTGFPDNPDNLKWALRGFLEATRDLLVSNVEGSERHFDVQATTRVPLPGQPSGILNGVLFEVPIKLSVHLDDVGRVVDV